MSAAVIGHRLLPHGSAAYVNKRCDSLAGCRRGGPLPMSTPQLPIEPCVAEPENEFHAGREVGGAYGFAP